jgi:predicted MPP superfamily phosphohydrolase
MRKTILLICALATASVFLWAQSSDVQFVFLSDVHYGLTRSSFRGLKDVDAHLVNTALVAKINGLGNEPFPVDGGRRSGEVVGPVDFVAIGGDIANRMEQTDGIEIQSAAKSWSQFRTDYLLGVHLTTRNGARTPVYVVPGNHDASNAVGFYTPMTPRVDNTSIVEIYNLMMAPDPPKTPADYQYSKDKVLVSHDLGGIHFIFLTIWPDSKTREWLEHDLKTVDSTVPVIIFTHDAPDASSKHFTNPNGKHDINDTDKFENLLSDTFADKVDGIGKVETPPLAEQKAWEAFLRRHPNVTAYFHGDSNWNQFYDWTGPDHTVVLHTFRVDSPMKGHFSAVDETKLSFQIATIDTSSRTMTVREVLWDADPQHPAAPVTWGSSTTVALSPRPPMK